MGLVLDLRTTADLKRKKRITPSVAGSRDFILFMLPNNATIEFCFALQYCLNLVSHLLDRCSTA
jgi:hypothetical protein